MYTQKQARILGSLVQMPFPLQGRSTGHQNAQELILASREWFLHDVCPSPFLSGTSTDDIAGPPTTKPTRSGRVQTRSYDGPRSSSTPRLRAKLSGQTGIQKDETIARHDLFHRAWAPRQRHSLPPNNAISPLPKRLESNLQFPSSTLAMGFVTTTSALSTIVCH
jgi:hypothetical protein